MVSRNLGSRHVTAASAFYQVSMYLYQYKAVIFFTKTKRFQTVEEILQTTRQR